MLIEQLTHCKFFERMTWYSFLQHHRFTLLDQFVKVV